MTALDPRQEAAVAQIHLEVLEENPLRFIGRALDLPVAADTQATEMIGWPFASWLLLTWLDAGLIDLCFDADLEPDTEPQSLRWRERAEVRDGYFALQTSDAQALLTDLTRWHASRSTSGLYPLRSDATDNIDYECWMQAARQSPTPAPPLGANPELIDSVAWQNAGAPWEEVSAGSKLYVVRWEVGGTVRWARVLAESRHQILEVNRDFTVWPERFAEWIPDLAEQVARVKAWVPNVISEHIELREIH